MKHLKQGDRVSFEGHDSGGYWRDGKGEILEIYQDRSWLAKINSDDYATTFLMARRTLRKLKPKAEPREWWLQINSNNEIIDALTSPPTGHKGCFVHVRESIPKK